MKLRLLFFLCLIASDFSGIRSAQGRIKSIELSGSFSTNDVFDTFKKGNSIKSDSPDLLENRVLVDSPIISTIVPKLNSYLSTHINEKCYLQFDKPFYTAGDTIYFKAYITAGEKHQLSNLSGVLHVDFLNNHNRIDQNIELKINGGSAWGDFAIPDSLSAGKYTIRAYTNWMRNDGDKYFFNHTIIIGSIHQNTGISLPLPKTTEYKIDLQFFPEGGNMVAGINSKIAFKAINKNGLGINAKGIITNKENTEVTSFTTTHAGMGYFYLKPEPGETYKAQITYADGKQDVAELPKASETGIILSINNDSIGKATVKIESNKAFYQQNKNKVFNLLILSGGTVNTVPCTLDSNLITLDILKRRLHTGIATVTLFSPTGEPLCERLIFIQNYDQLEIKINSDKSIYNKRDEANIMINVKTRSQSPSIGHFSVSVTDENTVPINDYNENNILANILLTSELRGYVEQPNYYFFNATEKTNSDLDLVMLTHGYRKFEWKKLLNNEYSPITYQPEKGIEIAGTVETINGTPISNGTISLIFAKSGQFLTGQTDNKGNFSFFNLQFTDSAQFVLNAANAKGNKNTKIIYKENIYGLPVYNDQLPITDVVNISDSYLNNSKKRSDDNSKYGTINGFLLKEVKIKETKIKDSYPSSNWGGAGHADQVIHRSEFKGGGQFSDQFNGVLRGVKFTGSNGEKVASLNSGLGFVPMLLVVDGSVLPSRFPIDEINVNSIETIEVLKGANASIYGADGGNGVLVITTRKGSGLESQDVASTGVLSITVKGFYKARQFYAPQYDHKKDNSPIRDDFRSTIYWKPELNTDKTGSASFSYYNGDGNGNYRIIIEGIDEMGNLGRQEYLYKVK